MARVCSVQQRVQEGNGTTCSNLCDGIESIVDVATNGAGLVQNQGVGRLMEWIGSVNQDRD